ncbi:LPS export ABC transporter permease LptF [Falsihalocynthiibacter sp. SS001]|uniref:LPS export ABC transporter permease LptF n=1 Tax=Falsihalocynthiibacter sp. SS001 TaxID=3349698 RepID=UPI0036D3194D
MARFDRYVLSQLIVLFGFFSLILVLVYWVNRAVSLFDTIISSGQSAGVFFELTALTLPRVIVLVLPFSAFVGTVYVINRLSTESELVVVQSSGYSPYRMARPVLVFGLIVALMMGILSHILIPASSKQITVRSAELSRNITAQLLVDGTFLHPTSGITLYIRHISPEGALNEILLSDARARDVHTTYTAKRALLVDDASGPKLLMFEGIAQSLRSEGQRLFTTSFQDLVFDIGDLIKPQAEFQRDVDQLSTWELLNPTPELMEESNADEARMLSTAHQRFAQPLLALVCALVGFSTLLLGGFSRFGLWPQIGLGIVLLIAIKAIDTAAVDVSLSSASLWWMAYTPSIFGIALSYFILWIAANPQIFRTLRRRGA